VRNFTAPQALIFDADDTLWENNILFERVIGDFIDWLSHPGMARDQVREVLDEIQRANSTTHGYGSKMLLLSLYQCAERLRERPVRQDEQASIGELASSLTFHEVELMPGVPETLTRLGERHKLLLLTKGDAEEQQRKLDASRLADRFAGIHIVAEKSVDTYRGLLDHHDLSPEHTWMIGNSPRSDIRPARAAGLNAVFIPHPHTWVLEHDDLDPADDRVITLRGFPDLLEHF
jgi:putative hydrolase of the HAD superfamily